MVYFLAHRNVLFVFALATAMTLSAPRVAAQGGEPPSFAIRGAKVVPVSGLPIDGATVVVSRGIITAVGKDVPIPPEAWVIEGKGLVVYPGLIDSLTDVGIPPAAPAGPPSSAGQGGGPRTAQLQALAVVSRGPEDRPNTTPWRSAADEASVNDKRLETWRGAGFTTVICSPTGGYFPGTSAVIETAGERSGDLVVKPEVAIPVSLNPLGGFANFPGSLMGVLSYVHQVWLDTGWYRQAEAGYDKSPRGRARPTYDRTAIALAAALDAKTIVLIPANNTVQLRRALGLPALWKVSGVIYGAQMAYEMAPEIAAGKMPVLVNLQWPEKPKDADPDEPSPLRALRFRDRAPSSPAELAKAGVKFAFYSGGITAPKDILKSAKKAIDAGLSTDDALRAMTLAPAEIFGVADRLGSIETGKIANLVVADGDIFDEKTKIKFVFVDGRRFETREPSRPSEPPKGDLTGKWKLSYNTPEGPQESTADLTMSADGTLSGTVTSTRGTATIISGYVSAEKFSFTINIPMGGGTSDITFSGTFEGTSMKGSISVGGFNVDFTGARPGGGRAISLGGAQ